MDVVTIVANKRGTTEFRIVNDYTYGEFEHIAGALVKEKMFVVSSIFSAFSKDDENDEKKKSIKSGGKKTTERKGPRKVSKWLESKLRPGVERIDLDGPLHRIIGIENELAQKAKKDSPNAMVGHSKQQIVKK